MRQNRPVILAAAWGAVVLSGGWIALRYEFTPAKPANPARRWPVASQVSLDARRPTLVMFVHPRCPCSRASLAELSHLAADCRDQVAIRIVFVRPMEFGEGWEQTDLWTVARRIPGAIVVCDPAGIEAAHFGAQTSGQTLLFRPDGRLVFDGGLTASRGHEGGNENLDAVRSRIESADSDFHQCPAFGCELFNHSPSE